MVVVENGKIGLVFLVCVAFSFSQECYDDGNQFCLDQDDILSVDLLPGSFLFMDQYHTKNVTKELNKVVVDGSFNKAFDEMDYHRKRMNEYLCHGYMAEEIVKEIGSPRVKRRHDGESVNSVFNYSNHAHNVTIHDKLLSDEGSSKYKDWLRKTTTLDDVYQHYAPHKKFKKKQGAVEEEDMDVEEFDGEVSGYMMPASVSSGKVGINHGLAAASTGYNYPSYDHGPPPMMGPMNHHPDYLPMVHEEHIYLPPSHDSHGPPGGKGGKFGDLSIRDFFEIALTALAFLSFGLFIIQLLMNITNAKNLTTEMMINPIIAAESDRFKRNILDTDPLSYSGNAELNELSHRVLRSIEAALVAPNDSGKCLRHLLCEDNKYSKETRGGPKIWVPMWSLGMSWVSGRMLKSAPWTAMLDSIKASVLGLGGADCDTLYPDCDLWKEAAKRRRRRRK